MSNTLNMSDLVLGAKVIFSDGTEGVLTSVAVDDDGYNSVSIRIAKPSETMKARSK
jgi:hypothetical protein